jgi:hypothetical protein
MGIWHVLIGAVLVLSGLASLYGLHRLCLWLKERGWLYYKHKKPSSSPASCFAALQQALEPRTRNVIHVREEKRNRSEDEAMGQGDPPPTLRGEEPQSSQSDAP